MKENIEIKAVARDYPHQREIAEHLSGKPGEVIRQEDTFFSTPRGRLKLRRFQGGGGELIFYQREDDPGPTKSEYILSQLEDPSSLHDVLGLALGVLGVVRKIRRLFLVGQTRVHLDEVEGLGSFIELEVVLALDQPTEEAIEIAQDLMEKLEIREEDLIERAYIDLLIEKTQAG